MAHGTIAAFEDAHGLSRDSVRGLLGGKQLRRAAHAVAGLMGTSVEALFPGRFMNPAYTSRKRESHRLNSDAA